MPAEAEIAISDLDGFVILQRLYIGYDILKHDGIMLYDLIHIQPMYKSNSNPKIFIIMNSRYLNDFNDGTSISDIQNIKEEYLMMHFQQIKIVLQSHYHYAFKLIKTLADLQPKKTHTTLKKNMIALQSIINRKKISFFKCFIRKIKNQKYSKEKSCVLIQQILQRKIIPTFQCFFHHLALIKPINRSIPKDIAMFLLLKKANLSKLVKFTMRDTFEIIKSYSAIRKEESKNLHLFKMMQILKLYINKQKINAFYEILGQGVGGKSNPQSFQEDEEEIFIETYKTMAVNFTKAKESQNSSLKNLKIKLGTTSIYDLLTVNLSNIKKWAFADILCHQNYKYKSSILQILQKQIAILQKQYESI